MLVEYLLYQQSFDLWLCWGNDPGAVNDDFLISYNLHSVKVMVIQIDVDVIYLDWMLMFVDGNSLSLRLGRKVFFYYDFVYSKTKE